MKLGPWIAKKLTTNPLEEYYQYTRSNLNNRVIASISGPHFPVWEGEEYYEITIDLRERRKQTKNKTKSSFEEYKRHSLEEAKAKADEILSIYYKLIDDKYLVLE